MSRTNWQEATYLAQIGNHSEEHTGAVNPPIYLSTTYAHPELGQSTGFDYTRTANPTRQIVQDAVARSENGRFGFATSSGMSAIQLVFELFPCGSRFLVSRDLYGGSYRYFNALSQQGKYHFDYFDTLEDLAEKINPEIAAVFLETPTNPLMTEVDILEVRVLTKACDALLIVDNTFYTPILQKPLDLGADIVVHSATKFLGGHNDLLAGAVITNSEKLGEKLAYSLNTTGAVLAPFDCWLLIRGLKTLKLRVLQQQDNTRELAAYLESEPGIKEVFYPGRGSMISIKLHSADQVPVVLSALELFTFAESLGSVESLVTYPTTQTHAEIPQELRESYGLTDNLLRLSIGIEDADDLITDLRQALEKATQ
ncbi:PLP-dependent transferase [Enterococcus sp. 669A]|uniref:PLP-dependent transferase n=1 Tax=Candidatus Enterococcus moelleringii TaxID=2815325 RepID=A0ABS3LAF4_9ENTE|nr:PLP-dependent transferase [Enterococcus sp. 669A]MBO1306018.1 PLP-dependent transferase [Enterococcus sp. 669A]